MKIIRLIKSAPIYHVIFPLIIIIFTAPPLMAETSSGSGDSGMINTLTITVLAATILAFIGHIMKQPLILAYIAAGIIIGPNIGLGLIKDMNDIGNITHFGLILLLFAIGLEININRLRESRKSLIISGLSQFPISLILGLGFFYLMGFPFGHGNYDLIYLAACCALSSTAIVVKILYGKFELDTLAGRISLGILLFQGLWVMMLLRTQLNLSNPGIMNMISSFSKAGLLVIVSLFTSKYFLPRFFRKIAKIPELVLVASLGWCLCICSVAANFDISMEMGALIAGISISTFPYNKDVIAKLINIRDFFLTLFFVSVGMQIPNPLDHFGLLLTAIITSLFLIFSRFISIFPVLYTLKNSIRVGLLTSINLSQLSEFSLIIAWIGIAQGHISNETYLVIIYVFVITAIFSTYIIKYNDPVQKALAVILRGTGLKDIGSIVQEETRSIGKEIALLGFHRTASSLVNEIIAADKGGDLLAGLKDKVVVVDFNPEIYSSLQSLGINVTYGDISNLNTLHQAGIHDVKIVISTIPDTILVGTDNLRIIKHIKEICPRAKIIVTAETAKRALKMYAEGADYVFIPHLLASKNIMWAVEMFLKNDQKEIASMIENEIKKLDNRIEVMQ